MYFITQGRIDVYATQDLKRPTSSLIEGAFFGEFQIILNHRHEYSARSVCNTDIYVLKKEDLDFAFSCYPEDRDLVKKATEERYKQAQNTKKSRKAKAQDDLDFEDDVLSPKQSVAAMFSGTVGRMSMVRRKSLAPFGLTAAVTAAGGNTSTDALAGIGQQNTSGDASVVVGERVGGNGGGGGRRQSNSSLGNFSNSSRRASEILQSIFSRKNPSDAAAVAVLDPEKQTPVGSLSPTMQESRPFTPSPRGTIKPEFLNQSDSPVSSPEDSAHFVEQSVTSPAMSVARRNFNELPAIEEPKTPRINRENEFHTPAQGSILETGRASAAGGRRSKSSRRSSVVGGRKTGVEVLEVLDTKVEEEQSGVDLTRVMSI
ncbi:hypothetical protein HDU98_004438 [Podochytrium sp. JEL0797]|nr:hypothetical protein HDU98_004438 [Podochytrium sp. JEL0797]